MRKLIQTSILVLALTALAACGDDESSTGAGFTGPDLSGTWAGEWRGGDIIMVLDQNGAEITGTIARGGEIYDLNGSVSTAGVFQWGAATPISDDCLFMSSSVDDFLVSQQNTVLAGVARRSEAAYDEDSDSCGGRALVQTGAMSLQRSF